MGFSSLPVGDSHDDYEDAFALAGQSGDVVLIQRSPPWSEFVPGSSLSNRTERLTRLEIDLASKNHLDVFLAIDVTEPGDRGRLAAAPPSMQDKDFSDNDVRDSLVAYARYLARNYKPRYLAVGVEVDLFYKAKGDAAFRNFQSVYFQAYDAVKEESESTQVFPTFQYENMRGTLHADADPVPLWSLVSRFDPKLDMLAVTSFPNTIYPVVTQLPADYYHELRERTEKPLALSSIGWSSRPKPGDLGSEGVAEQTEYVKRVLKQCELLPASLLVWYLGRDRDVAGEATDPLSGMGLNTRDGKPKDSALAWRVVAERPPEA
jgi:hypothetical protein